MNSNLNGEVLSSENSGLVGYWDFNEGSDQQVSDKSYFQNNGILGSSAGVDSKDPIWVSSEVIVGISDSKSHEFIPMSFSLEQNYPNPFNPTTNISFTIPKESNVKLLVYDVNGRLVETLEDRKFEKGIYSKSWDASNFASGVYFIKLSSQYFDKTVKSILMR